jgi:C4-dicarboxylate-binding protein DctP
MQRIRTALAFGVGAALFFGAGQAIAQQPIVIKFSHVVATDAPKHKAAEKFKELAEKALGNKVKVELYANSSLYKDKEEIEALQLGAVQMLAPSTSKFAPLGIKEFEALDLPYLFRDEATFKKFSSSPVGKELLDKLETRGIKGLAYWDNGFHVMGASKPVIHVADFRGLKLRIQGSKILDAETRALGAIPQVLAFSELYQALQTGVVDGAENVPSNYWTQKMYEVVKFINVSHHGHLSYAVVVNKKFWDGLPGDVRPELEKAMEGATEYFNSIAKKENDDGLEEIRKTGKVTIHKQTEDERNEWIKALADVHRDAEKRVGKEIIAKLYEVTGFSLTH